MKEIFNLEKIAGGTVNRVVNVKMKRLIENIMDTSTEALRPRKLIVTITVIPNDVREEASVDIDVQTKLEKPKTISTKIAIKKDMDGEIQATELTNENGVKGQIYINDDGDICDDRGEAIHG